MKFRQSKHRSLLSKVSLALGVLGSCAASLSQLSAANYYIGVDNLATIASGTYAGLANPNKDRLTFLYAHWYDATPSSNHYHSKGRYIHTGPNLGAATATTVSSANFLPESGTLTMVSGTGAYAGKLVIEANPSNPFSFLSIEDTGKLSGFADGTPEFIMFNSSSGRWNSAITGADVHMKLLNATAGLNFGTSSDPNVNPFADAEGLHLADSFSFTLNPWVDAGAAPGTYSAQFMLEDEEGVFGDSGTFEFRFTVIPEPSGTLLSMISLGMLSLRRRRNHA